MGPRVARSATLAVALVVLAVACSPATPDNARALDDVAAQRSGDEVVVSGTVVRVLRPSFGADGEHERFVVEISDRARSADIVVAHNVSIAGWVPLRRGGAITLKGQLESDPSGPVIHWTHHDPRFHHEAGFVTFAGATYQ